MISGYHYDQRLPHHGDQRRKPLRWESTTGLSAEQLSKLVARCDGLLGEWDKGRGRPRALSFFNAVVGTVAVLRKNLAQAVVGDFLNTSQSTISRTLRYFRPVVAAVLTEFVPDVVTACAGEVPLVDGTLVPTGNRAGQPELYSGQRHRAGVNVHVLATTRRRQAGTMRKRCGAPTWTSMPISPTSSGIWDILALASSPESASHRAVTLPRLRENSTKISRRSASRSSISSHKSSSGRSSPQATGDDWRSYPTLSRPLW